MTRHELFSRLADTADALQHLLDTHVVGEEGARLAAILLGLDRLIDEIVEQPIFEQTVAATP